MVIENSTSPRAFSHYSTISMTDDIILYRNILLLFKIDGVFFFRLMAEHNQKETYGINFECRPFIKRP